MLASRYSNTDSTNATVELLLKAGAKIDLQENEGWTALMMASLYSRTDSTHETVQLLLEAGADVDLREKDGWTALMMACRYYKTDSTIATIELLLEADANIDLLKGSKTAFDFLDNNLSKFLNDTFKKEMNSEKNIKFRKNCQKTTIRT